MYGDKRSPVAALDHVRGVAENACHEAVKIRVLSPISHAFRGGGDEKANLGRDGTTTWNDGWSAGEFVRKPIILWNSQKEPDTELVNLNRNGATHMGLPGHPCRRISGIASGRNDFMCMK